LLEPEYRVEGSWNKRTYKSRIGWRRIEFFEHPLRCEKCPEVKKGATSVRGGVAA